MYRSSIKCIIQKRLKKALSVFCIIKSKILPASDLVAQEYYNSVEVREIVKDMAIEGGLRVFETRENIHMVTGAYGSMFCQFVHTMKEKYKALERKDIFT